MAAGLTAPVTQDHAWACRLRGPLQATVAHNWGMPQSSHSDEGADAAPAPASPPAPGRQYVTALARGLQLLSCFRAGDVWLCNQDMAERCDLPRSTVSRLTYTLTHSGYLLHDPVRGRYRLGPASLSLAGTSLTQWNLLAHVRPHMQTLSQALGVDVAVGMADRHSMLYLESCSHLRPQPLPPGSRLPIAISAMGRAWYAGSEPAVQARTRSLLRQRFPQRWPVMAQALEQALRDTQRYGVACSFGEWRKQVNAIGVSFSPGAGLPRLALNCGATSFCAQTEWLLQDVRPRLLSLAATLDGCMAS